MVDYATVMTLSSTSTFNSKFIHCSCITQIIRKILI